MRVIISSRGVVLTPPVKALVERKVGKLARVLPEARDARLVCEAEKFRRTARLGVRGRRRTFASQATAVSLVSAVEAAVEALRRQLCMAKDRRRSPRRVA